MSNDASTAVHETVNAYILAALQASNPGLRIMSAEEARRLNFLPADDNMSDTPFLNRSPATRSANTAPPVAVVQGKQMTVQHSNDKSSR